MHSLLRRGVTTAVSKILGTNQALRGNNIIGLPSTQIRSSSVFKINIFESFAQYRKVSKLKSLVDQDPTEENTLEYVKALCKVEPKEAAALIERGWTNNKLPINENFVREYLKAAAAINGLDKVNVGALLHMIRVHGNDKGSATLQAGFTGGLSNIMKGTKDEPMHVISRVETTFKDHLIAIVKTVLLGCIIFAFAGAVLDDRGITGGAGGRIGQGSAVHMVENSDKTFKDVVGVDEAKQELEEIVLYLKDPLRFTRLGGKLPKGVLLTGPPGTGKTLLARAIAGEAKVPFFHASGSEFEELYVGVGAKRVRELFEAAKAHAPCIIFIDEIDAVGGSRHLKDQSAMKMTLNQLLVEMDGFAQNNGIIVIGATNFVDSLDAALVRPGRFDRNVNVPLPDIGGRKAILELYGQKVLMEKEVDYEQLARGTPGFSGADLFNLINQAALKSSIDGNKKVTMAALEYAKDKLMMGAERRTAVISAETMKLTAYHEAGHALVAVKTKGADPVHKATIMPRGRALGMVMQLPDGDQTSMSRQQMLARLDICMAGRVAEELVFGSDMVTSGASSDIKQATRLARAMVSKYGLSEKVGMVYIDDDDRGGNSTKTSSWSAQVHQEIDDEVKRLLHESYQRAKVLLEGSRKELDLLADALMQYESLSGSEIMDVIHGKAITQAKRSQKPSRALQSIELMRNQSAAASVNNDEKSASSRLMAKLNIKKPTRTETVQIPSNESKPSSVDTSNTNNNNNNTVPTSPNKDEEKSDKK